MSDGDLQQKWLELIKKRTRRNCSPSFPSPPEVEIYEKYLRVAINGQANPKVLILGATPELRDLALRNGCDTVALDFSAEVLEIMGDVMTYKNDAREKRVVGNWLEYQGEEYKFDAILADASLNNIPVAATAHFLNKLQTLLNQNGLFITRHLVCLPDKKIRPAVDIIADYRRGAINQYDMYFGLRFYSDLSRGCYDPATKRSDWGCFFEAFEKAKGLFNQEEYDGIMWQKADVVHTMFTKDEWESLTKEFFDIVAVGRWTGQHFSEFFPVYILKRR